MWMILVICQRMAVFWLNRWYSIQYNVVKIDQDLSLKHVGPLALARLYGKFCIIICYRKAVEEDFLGFLGNWKAVEEN
jgi:hypothetical protein